MKLCVQNQRLKKLMAFSNKVEKCLKFHWYFQVFNSWGNQIYFVCLKIHLFGWKIQHVSKNEGKESNQIYFQSYYINSKYSIRPITQAKYLQSSVPQRYPPILGVHTLISELIAKSPREIRDWIAQVKSTGQ